MQEHNKDYHPNDDMYDVVTFLAEMMDEFSFDTPSHEPIQPI